MGVLAAILVAWLLAGGVFLGIGLLVSALAGTRPNGGTDSFAAFWLGFAATVAALQVWHLLFAVNTWLVLVLGAVGSLGIATRGPRLTAFRVPASRAGLTFGALALGAIWFGLMGLRPLEIYDAGLYHLQAIAWDTTYPTVPGLGNLHGRLAFNSSLFLVLALFEQGPLVGESFRVVNGLLALAFLAQVARSAIKVVSTQDAHVADWLLALIALPAAAAVGASGLATTSTDLPIFPLQALIAYSLLRWLDDAEPRTSRLHLGVAVVLAAVSVTVKVSSAGFAVSCLGLAVCLAVARARTGPTPTWRPPPVMLGLSCALIAGLVANGVVLSGHPFYPSTLLSLPVDWRVPDARASMDAAGIVLFARQPGPLADRVYQGWGWFPDWLAANAADLAPPALAAMLGVLVTIGPGSRKVGRALGGLVVLGPVWAGLGLWFLTAPAPRFAGALFWLAGAIPVAVVRAGGRSRTANLAVGAFVLASILPPQTEQLSLLVRAPIAALRRGTAPLPVSGMSVYFTDSGLQLYVPSDSELAWAAPLPSTPKPDPGLRARCSQNLACGFVLDTPS